MQVVSNANVGCPSNVLANIEQVSIYVLWYTYLCMTCCYFMVFQLHLIFMVNNDLLNVHNLNNDANIIGTKPSIQSDIHMNEGGRCEPEIDIRQVKA